MSFSEQTLDLLTAGQYEEAKKKFAWALRKDDDEMVHSLAEELAALGFTNMAKRAYEKLLARYPDEDELRVDLAELAVNAGDDDQALDYLAQIPPTSPAYLQSLLAAADLYQTQGLFEVAEQKLLEALRLAPDEQVIQFALAELYFDIKQYRQAVTYYLGLIKQGVTHFAQVNLVQRLGVSYAEAGKFVQALGYLEQIHEEDLDADARFQLAFTQLQLKHYDDARKNFEKLRELNPDYATLYPYLADIYVHQGNPRQALATLQEGIGVDEYNPQLYERASRLAEQLGDDKLARQYLQTIVDQDPDNVTGVRLLSDLLVRQGDAAANRELLTTYLKDGSPDAHLLWNLGRADVALDNYDAALQHYDAARAELMTDAEFVRDAAFFYRNAGCREAAQECVAAALRFEPDDPDMLRLQDELLG
ncbi:tetratricopeptide repeat protein [Ligilactobacillus sp. LYQ60]|uniref:tetratricopeptide repeat protein n=1 Tax=unclassified Ligilactobacillus TaxID=2767920 RepID=UPI003854346B